MRADTFANISWQIRATTKFAGAGDFPPSDELHDRSKKSLADDPKLCGA